MNGMFFAAFAVLSMASVQPESTEVSGAVRAASPVLRMKSGAPSSAPPPVPAPVPAPEAASEVESVSGPRRGGSEPDGPVQGRTGPAAAAAASGAGAPPEAKRSSLRQVSERLSIGGYVQPQYSMTRRRGARPRDQRELGAEDSRAGLIFTGTSLGRWSFRVHATLGTDRDDLVTNVESVDRDGDGGNDALSVSKTSIPAVTIEQLWVKYRPVQLIREGRTALSVDVKLGHMRVPLTQQTRTNNASLLFPRRNQAVTTFLARSDLGALANIRALEGRIQAAAGVFNGTGLAIGSANRRGPLLSGTLSVAPLGAIDSRRRVMENAVMPRFSLGGGVLYTPFRLYDNVGNDTLTRSRELIASASARFTVHGLELQGEALRRQVTDNLSSRDYVSTSAYGQAAFFAIVTPNVRIAPVGNVGWSASEQDVRPIRRVFTTDGVSLYLAAHGKLDTIRVSVLYIGEWLLDEHQRADGATLQVQYKF